MIEIPLTRTDALAIWREFLPRVGRYAKDRNYVHEQHRNVSLLSTAIRHRLISEDQIIDETLNRYSFSTAEKWLQEICWRRYWKGWLERRPDVWTSWRNRVEQSTQIFSAEVLERAAKVATGQSGVACMDALAHQLVEKGYLHNHARMWWASFWIHAEKLPWELGADFFYRHLLDADPASNTLSWRWVAGLQTFGKTYTVRLSNLEKYADDSLLQHTAGNQRIADGAFASQAQEETADLHCAERLHYPDTLTENNLRSGLWLHSEDLLPEVGPFSRWQGEAIAVQSCEIKGISGLRQKALAAVTADAVKRATEHFNLPVTRLDQHEAIQEILAWAKSNQLLEIIAFAPTIGAARDMLPSLTDALTKNNISLQFVRRRSDHDTYSYAQSGFFPYWKKMSQYLAQPTLL